MLRKVRREITPSSGLEPLGKLHRQRPHLGFTSLDHGKDKGGSEQRPILPVFGRIRLDGHRTLIPRRVSRNRDHEIFRRELLMVRKDVPQRFARRRNPVPPIMGRPEDRRDSRRVLADKRVMVLIARLQRIVDIKINNQALGHVVWRGRGRHVSLPALL
ncbi:hypothetical protein D3C73_1309390 [compost metagenome]